MRDRWERLQGDSLTQPQKLQSYHYLFAIFTILVPVDTVTTNNTFKKTTSLPPWPAFMVIPLHWGEDKGKMKVEFFGFYTKIKEKSVLIAWI